MCFRPIHECRVVSIAAAVAVVVCAFASQVSAQSLVSNFDGTAEGWTVETRSNPAGSFSLIGAFVPDFVSTGGSPGGYISEVDPDGNWSFFRAPLAWSGDRSMLFGGWLHYSTRTDADSFPDGRLVVLVGDGGVEISTDLGIPDLNTWTRRRVGLRAGGDHWFVGTNASGTLASDAVIEGVLTDLEGLYIGLEFGADQAEERVDLDSVNFSGCVADLNGDGELDFLDISEFLSTRPDVTGDAQFDFLDISAFLMGYTGGCP